MGVSGCGVPRTLARLGRGGEHTDVVDGEVYDVPLRTEPKGFEGFARWARVLSKAWLGAYVYRRGLFLRALCVSVGDEGCNARGRSGTGGIEGEKK